MILGAKSANTGGDEGSSQVARSSRVPYTTHLRPGHLHLHESGPRRLILKHGPCLRFAHVVLGICCLYLEVTPALGQVRTRYRCAVGTSIPLACHMCLKISTCRLQLCSVVHVGCLLVSILTLNGGIEGCVQRSTGTEHKTPANGSTILVYTKVPSVLICRRGRLVPFRDKAQSATPRLNWRSATIELLGQHCQRGNCVYRIGISGKLSKIGLDDLSGPGCRKVSRVVSTCVVGERLAPHLPATTSAAHVCFNPNFPILVRTFVSR